MMRSNSNNRSHSIASSMSARDSMHSPATASMSTTPMPMPMAISAGTTRTDAPMDSLAMLNTSTVQTTPARDTSFSMADEEEMQVQVQAKEEKEPASPPKAKKKKANTPSASNAKKPAVKKTPTKRTPKKAVSSPTTTGSQPNLNEQVPDITEAEYANLDALMAQFCKVPLLAEFSRPVSLLHPELTPLYKKVVQFPIDLGKICRAIRKRQYINTRQVCVDVWRIFSNCVKYHTHPITREGAIPSFISIANHLREYFNALWMEYMIASEVPAADKEKDPVMVALKNSDKKRSKIRTERQNMVAAVVLSSKLIEKASDAMTEFVEMEGRVDALDQTSILGGSDNDGEVNAAKGAFAALSGMAARLREIAHSEYEYTVESLNNDLKRCYGDEIFEGLPWLKIKFENRLNRLLGKLIVPVNEVSCRGVNQSSVWGCMAAAIWARENTKKPYWPALVLGIMAPDDQQEDWHKYLTQRNEARLPEKLQTGLQTGKKKALQAVHRQNDGKSERMSYFLVEFLGTHEFIWVREADIIENFDPEEDVNQQLASVGNITKKKKTSLRGQTAANARMLQKGTDEGRWALEEFEMLLNDPCGDQMEDMMDDEEEEENYTYPVLCESDDEADEADGGLDKKSDCSIVSSASGKVFDTPTGVITDIDEINELLATDGKLDYTTEGRKNAKLRAVAMKKQQVAEAKKSLSVKKESKKAKTPTSKTSTTKSGPRSEKATERAKQQGDVEYKKELKELERRRKKRGRERERVLKEEEKKSKKMKVDGNSSMIRRGRKLGIADKRGRATGLVQGYVNRIAARDGLKGLGLGGVSTLPAANVEGSGLLGLALAFRAGAGELDMPNSDDNPTSVKPWDHVDVDGPATSEERSNNLEKQILLLEKALEKLDEDDNKRRRLIEVAREEKEQYDNDVVNAEKDARQNDMPKRKVSVKRKNSVDVKQEVKKETDNEEDEDATDKNDDIDAKQEEEGEEHIESSNVYSADVVKSEMAEGEAAELEENDEYATDEDEDVKAEVMDDEES